MAPLAYGSARVTGNPADIFWSAEKARILSKMDPEKALYAPGIKLKNSPLKSWAAGWQSSEERVRTALQELTDPVTGKDYVSGKKPATSRSRQRRLRDILLGYPAKSVIDGVRRDVIAKLKTIPGVGNVSANVQVKIIAPRCAAGRES